MNFLLLIFIALFQMNCGPKAIDTTATATQTVITNEVDFWLTKANKSVLLEKQNTILGFGTTANVYSNIEVDENQHVNYDCSCENKRLMEISQDVGHRNIVFVRFNPDQYINKDGIKINTCWTINKSTKLLCVSKTNNKEWTNRLNSLMQQVQYWLDNKSEKMVETVQLFYDEC